MKMFATTALLIAGILINQAFAQNAQNATTNTQKSPKTEMKAASKEAAVPATQKSTEPKAVSSQTQTAKPAGTKVAKTEATAMNKEASHKHHRGHKAYKNASGSINKNKSESTGTAKPIEKPKTH